VLAAFPRLDEQVTLADARRAILVRGLAVHEALRTIADASPFRRQLLLAALQSVPPEQLRRATPYFWAHLRAAYAALAAGRIADLAPWLDRVSLAALDSFASLPGFQWQGELESPSFSGFHAQRLGLSSQAPDRLRAIYRSPGSVHFVFADGHEAAQPVSECESEPLSPAAGPVCAVLHAAEVDLGENADKLETSIEGRNAFAAQLEEASAVVAAASPNAAAVVSSEVQHVIPLRMADRHLSFSLSNLPGAIFVGAGRSRWPVAEALVHEAAHLRLNHAAEAAPLTLGSRDTVCYSPWRDDPRPVEGVVHGVYAFSLVLGFWLEALGGASRCLDAQGLDFAVARCAELSVQLEDAFSVLRRCRLAQLADLVASRLEGLLPERAATAISAAEYERARRHAAAHRQHVLAAFPGLIVPDLQ
jgi:HEXXH motif-containing protein